jgi:hypothetical protein
MRTTRRIATAAAMATYYMTDSLGTDTSGGG